ncbi:MAG: glycoside hydrolase family 32 protein [Cytophagales bacterium]|nr:glycoside hydrolase family 32 protein [Cytophagales bacterium]
MRPFHFLLLFIVSIACKETEPITMTYRPEHHFTPPQNWTNDPNGLVYLDGEYHFFYQYNPFGDKWGHMSWGHAVSTDLMHWEHLPLALPEFDIGDGTTTMIYSGSAVIDSANTSGFFEEGFTKGMVAIFTSNVDSSGVGIAQHQSLAYSSDKGRTWQYYDRNPVLDIGLKDFRDPNVIWNEKRNSWLMSVVKPLEFTVQFYESKNLKEWTLLSEFGKTGDTSKIWECPALFKVPVENSEEEKWVLLVSSGHKTKGYVGMQYFVGDFDGTTFQSQKQEDVFQLDAGKDFYAAIPFNNRPESQKKPIIMGWANNWAYSGDIPTNGFRGGFSFPRELMLYKEKDIYRLKNAPIVSNDIPEFSLSKGDKPLEFDKPVFHVKVENVDGRFELLIKQSEEEFTKITVEEGILSFDRTRSGKTDFNKAFPSVDSMQLGEFSNLDIYMDHSYIEVFVNDGKHAMTQQVFPNGHKVEVSLIN